MRNWEDVVLGDVASIQIGGTPSRDVDAYWATDFDSGFPWVSIADLKGRVITETKERITERGVAHSNVKPISAGTLLMSFKLSIGRAALAGMDLYTNEAIAAIVPKDKRVHPELLYFVLPPVAKNAITDTAVKGSTLNKSSLGKLTFRVPPDYQLQGKIARILQTVDRAIESTEALIEKYQQIKAGLMHDLFTRGVGADGKLRPRHDQAPELYQQTPIGWIPKEWAYKPLEQGLSTSPKNGFSPKEVDTWQDLYVLGLGCLTKSGFRPVQLKNAPRSALGSGAKLEDGDFLISRSNTQELVGLCGIFRKVGHDAIYSDLMVRLKLNQNLVGKFLEKYLLSKAVRQRIAALAVGTSGSMVKLNAASIKALKI
ncbi:restriction endonuclease subunit S, partial [Sedimenticola hydrogenitrophicus]|uniref:restriction endonuclease subunit S n=1 Tax=Sedimenticola hydrogenitrophicus TaxID=2967975 RepID=UPI0021A814D4